jgi:hypothetical protein
MFADVLDLRIRRVDGVAEVRRRRDATTCSCYDAPSNAGGDAAGDATPMLDPTPRSPERGSRHASEALVRIVI